MGIVWEAYHKRVPLLGVPENPTEQVPLEISFDALQVKSWSSLGMLCFFLEVNSWTMDYHVDHYSILVSKQHSKLIASFLQGEGTLQGEWTPSMYIHVRCI